MDVLKVLRHRTKRFYGRKCESAFERYPKFHSQEFLDATKQSDMHWLSVDGTPHACSEPPAGRQDPRDLPHSGNPIGKELQPLLAQHHIKTAVRERHIDCATLLPFDIGYFASSVQ